MSLPWKNKNIWEKIKDRAHLSNNPFFRLSKTDPSFSGKTKRNPYLRRSFPLIGWEIKKLWHRWLPLRIAVYLIVVYILVIFAGRAAIYKERKSNWLSNFAEKIFPYPAAIAGNDVIYLNRFRAEATARQAYATKHKLPGGKKEIEKLVMTQLVNKSLYNQELRKQKMVVKEKDIDKQLENIYKESGGKEKLVSFLKDNYGPQITLDDFRLWIKESFIEAAIQHQLLTQASVRHILIALPENASAEQTEKARIKAEEVKQKAADLSKFSEVAKDFSEDIASRDKGGDLGTTSRGNEQPVYSKEFEDLIFSTPVGQLAGPVRSQYGWHIVIVDKRDGKIDKSLKAFTEDLRGRYKVKTYLGN